MRMYDVILKKRNGGKLTRQEIEFFISGYVAEEIPDYQASAFMMAIYFMGLDAQETSYLTDAMARSGEIADLSSLGVVADKHSTGGVADTTTLIAARGCVRPQDSQDVGARPWPYRRHSR